MTLLLVAGLYATLSIWGDSPVEDVAVARAETFAPALPDMRTAPAATPSDSPASQVSDHDAIAMALAAGSTDAPAPEPGPAATVPAPVAAQAAAAGAAEQLWYITGSRVNLRDGPTTNSAIVGSVVQGDRAELLSDPADTWVRIRTHTGLEAWIFGRFLSETPA